MNIENRPSAHEHSHAEFLKKLTKDFDALIARHFSNTHDISEVAKTITTLFPHYQFVLERKMSPEYIEKEKSISCSAATYILGSCWESIAKGNVSYYYVEPGDPRNTHTFVALFPQQFDFSTLHEQYRLYSNGKKNSLIFYEFSRPEHKSQIAPVIPTPYYLLASYCFTKKEEYLRNRSILFTR